MKNKQSQADCDRTRDTKQRFVLWISVCALLVGIVASIAFAVRSSDKQQGSVARVGADFSKVTEKDWVKGGEVAQTTLVEYSDFQCPACRAYHLVVQQLEKEFGKTLRIVYRHFPLTAIHRNAEGAARAAEAAGKQGKFWEMHDLLFDYQSAWSKEKNSLPSFLSYAKSLGLDTERFTRDMESGQVRERISESIRAGRAVRLQGTPTFFLNGQQIDNPTSVERFKKIIRDAMQ